MIGVACLAFAPCLRAGTHTYEVTFDTQFTSGNAQFSEPFIMIQNPSDSGGLIDIDSVTLTWNDADSITTSVDGVIKHTDSTDCDVLSTSVGLAQGDGVTISVAEALQHCSDFPDCTATTCTDNNDCGTDCRCMQIVIPPFGLTGRCVPDFDSGTVPNTSRVSVEIVVDDSASDYEGPIVEAFEVLLNSATPPGVIGFREARVMDADALEHLEP